jgi:hypothetical protein
MSGGRPRTSAIHLTAARESCEYPQSSTSKEALRARDASGGRSAEYKRERLLATSQRTLLFGSLGRSFTTDSGRSRWRRSCRCDPRVHSPAATEQLSRFNAAETNARMRTGEAPNQLSRSPASHRWRLSRVRQRPGLFALHSLAIVPAKAAGILQR